MKYGRVVEKKDKFDRGWRALEDCGVVTSEGPKENKVSRSTETRTFEILGALLVDEDSTAHRLLSVVGGIEVIEE